MNAFALVVMLLVAEAAAEPVATPSEKRGALTLRGLDGQELRLRLEPGATRFTYTLHIDETANARVDGARLRVTGLTDESGAQVSPLRVAGEDGQPFRERPVEPGGSLQVTLEADLPAPGTYGATLTLLRDGALQSSARLVVIRPRSALNTRIDVAPVRGYTPLLESQGAATLQLMLHEQEGRPILLSPPVLARLLLAEGAPGNVGTQALADARFLDSKGQPLGAPFLLGAGETLPLRLALSGLPGPGRYEGTIRLGAADAPSVDTPFVLYLRDPPVFAFLLIALGVVLSFLVRKYVAHERPRMLLQQRVLEMARALEELKSTADLPAGDQELVAAVAREVDATHAGISSQAGGLRETGGRLELLERKVACTRNLLRLRRALADMRPALLRAEPQTKLAQVERPLREPHATAEDLSTAEATLAALPSELDARMRQHLSERLALFREELDSLTLAPDSELTQQLERHVRPHLDKAGELLDRDLKTASSEFDAARLARTSLLADRLTASLEAPVPTLLGRDEWVTLRTKASVLLEPLRQTPPPPVDTAVAAYESALALYLRTHGRALADKAHAHLRRVSRDEAGQKEQELWQRVLDSAGNIPSRLSERKLPEAVLALEAAREAFEKASRARSGDSDDLVNFAPDEPEAPRVQPVEVVPAWLFDDVRLFVPRLEGKPPAVGLARLERRLASLDLFILVLVLLLASLAGLRLLWMEDPSWGSMNDRLLALIWGFGLHQAIHPGLANLLGHGAKQGTPAAAPAPDAPGA